MIAALSRFPRAVLLQPVSRVLQTSERARTRAACLRVVGAVGDQRDLELLCSAVRPRDKGAELDPSLSQEFEQAVGGILLSDETAFVSIKRCLRIEPSATRKSLFRALADTVSEPGLEELGQNLGIHPDEDPLLLGEMKRASALIRLPVPDSIPNYLRPRLVEDDPYRLALAVECIGSLEDTDSLDALLPLLRHSDPEVARAAHAALCSITGIRLIPDPKRWDTWLQSETAWFADELPRLASEFRRADGPACASAIAEMAAHPLHRRELAEMLGRDLARRPPVVRDMACAALRQLGGAYALQSLDRCAQDLDGEAASRAQRALAGLPRRPGRAQGSDALR